MPLLPESYGFTWYRLGGNAAARAHEIIDMRRLGKIIYGQDELRRITVPLGLLNPSTQIFVENGRQRARVIWPEIYSGLNDRDTDLYLAVPGDYRALDGKQGGFIPEESTPLDEQESAAFDHAVGLAWGQKIALINFRIPMEIKVPEDFDPGIHSFSKGSGYSDADFLPRPPAPPNP